MPQPPSKRCLLLLVAAATLSVAVAQEPKSQTPHRHDAPSGRSKQDVLIQDPLYAIPGKQAHLLRIEYPAGWIGERHYHTGDVFLYVLSGGFTIDVDGAERKTIRAGQAYHEALNKVMQARNASTSEPTTILLFQVGNQGERTTVVSDQPPSP
jgi:quercetin dioxygenase-like cupin family protein